MAKIEGFNVRNFRSLRNVTLGRLWNDFGSGSLTPMTAVIGKNGAGKSTLFDAFGFLADCLINGVEKACDQRNGFKRIVSQGVHEPIMFEIYYREEHNARPITYEVAFALDKHERPYVKSERLRQRRKGQERGRPFSFLILEEGRGVVWKGESEGVNKEPEQLTLHNIEQLIREEPSETESVELSDNRKLGIATLGALKQHPRISAFRQFIEGWYLSYFSPNAARGLPLAGPQPHLNVHGDNIGNVVQFMERDHPERFKKILSEIATKLPGIDKISTEAMPDGRLLLRFNESGFANPFSAQQMSDGTLKVFAYLLLLADPQPRPFLCIEEPENGLYHKLLETLANQFRTHVTERKVKSQIFVTTHQPYFLDALTPEEVWILEKGADGFSTIRRASDDPIVKGLVKEDLPLGGLWYSDYLEGGQG
ncbi:MAG: AAA family ATPase [Defluviitaleaceae bacterium]|nr:AAA family ATPase [Defluviitaleaceae bacterium]MCL2238427.1 AAA family ATPase [Defluviitaleaceae bacterium]